MSKELLKFENIYKSYGKVEVLKNINLSLYENETLGLLGDNGAGKSTLIKCLSGLEEIDKGNIFINEKKINPKKYNIKKARTHGLETVYQDSSLAKEQEIYKNIFLGRELINFFGFVNIKKEKAISLNLLKNFLGLRGSGVLADSKVSTLSGGERQGLAIARAVHFNSKIIILDEPTTALGIKEVKKVLDFIQALKEHKKSSIFITHNLAHAYELSTRFLIIDRGEVKKNILKKDISLQGLQNILLEVAK